jgi:hypothetical protein
MNAKEEKKIIDAAYDYWVKCNRKNPHVLTSENFNKLKSTCQKIIGITDENIAVRLTVTQVMFLKDNIQDFLNNPIVQNSGSVQELSNNFSDVDF